jgi:hypothetical protein
MVSVTGRTPLIQQALAVEYEALNCVVRMAFHGERDALALKRIEREAKRMLDENRGLAHVNWTVLGFTHYMRGSMERSVLAFNAAVSLAPTDPAVLGNAASVLVNGGEVRRAMELVRRLVEVGDDRASSLEFAAAVMKKSICFEEAATYDRAHEALSGVEGHRTIERYESFAAACDKQGLIPEVRIRLLETAVSAVRTGGAAILQCNCRVYPDDVSARYEILVGEVAADECGLLNFAIADAIVGQFEEPFAELLTFACRPMSSYVPHGQVLQVAR